jgi:hypothetical protein
VPPKTNQKNLLHQFYHQKKKYFTYIPKTLRVEVSVLALSPEIDDRGEVEAKILFHPVILSFALDNVIERYFLVYLGRSIDLESYAVGRLRPPLCINNWC